MIPRNLRPSSLGGTSRVVLGVAAILLLPGLLWAHARLVRSDPAQGATLEKAPTQVRLVFSEKPEIALATIRLIGGFDTVALAPLELDPADPHVIVAPIGSPLKPGPYRIAWRVAARDGHPVSGAIDFFLRDAVNVPVSSDETPGMRADSSAMPAETDSGPIALGGALGFILVRWLGFASLFVLIGAVAFRFLVLNRLGMGEADAFVQIASTNAATFGFAAAATLLLSSLLKLARESLDMPDIPMSSMLFGSTWGWSLLIQIIVALVAVAAFRAAHGRYGSSRANAWRVALAAATALGIAPALGGHAIGGDRAYLAVSADIVHVLAGSAWVGTLAVIVVVGIPAALKTPDAVRPGARVASMINAFSPMALICGGAVVATGVGSSMIHLPRLAALWTTPYGFILAPKLVFVALLFAAGAWNWRRMKPRLPGDDAIAPMQRSASLELLLAAVVLGITAVLVAVELP